MYTDCHVKCAVRFVMFFLMVLLSLEVSRTKGTVSTWLCLDDFLATQTSSLTSPQLSGSGCFLGLLAGTTAWMGWGDWWIFPVNLAVGRADMQTWF